MSYCIDDAIRALFKFYTDQGFDERSVNQPSSIGFDNDDGYHFIYCEEDDEVLFEVQFNDDDGNATVTITGDPESPRDVNIREDEDEDDE
jgi:hypothetical protein